MEIRFYAVKNKITSLLKFHGPNVFCIAKQRIYHEYYVLPFLHILDIYLKKENYWYHLFLKFECPVRELCSWGFDATYNIKIIILAYEQALFFTMHKMFMSNIYTLVGQNKVLGHSNSDSEFVIECMLEWFTVSLMHAGRRLYQIGIGFNWQKLLAGRQVDKMKQILAK